MVFRLNNDLVFPDPSLAEPSGLLAIGGDLSPERLLLAYQSGIFPWFNPGEEILWYSPNPRFVLFPNEVIISKSMQKLMRKTNWHIRENLNFDQVVNHCASINRPDQFGTWIGEEMKIAYQRLFELGYAKSIEVYDQQHNLIGGLYGVELNHCFFGESMFSLVSNASKLALIHLCQQHSFRLIDCQVYTSHLESMGARDISLSTFLELIQYS